MNRLKKEISLEIEKIEKMIKSASYNNREKFFEDVNVNSEIILESSLRIFKLTERLIDNPISI